METPEYTLCERCDRNYWTGKDEEHERIWHTPLKGKDVRHTDYGIADD